jgi:hypothetical protein
MHQDQGDASQVSGAYVYAYGRLYIYGPYAFEIEQPIKSIKKSPNHQSNSRSQGSSE